MVVSLWSQDGSGANHVSQEKEDDRTMIPTPQLMYNQGGVPDKTPYIFTVVPFCLLGKGGHTFLREFGTGVPLFINLSWQ